MGEDNRRARGRHPMVPLWAALMVGLAVVAALHLLYAYIYVIGPAQQDKELTLKELLTGPDYSHQLVSSPQDLTAEQCPGASGCIEAWRTDQADYFRFSSASAASAWAQQAGPKSCHSGYRVVVNRGVTTLDGWAATCGLIEVENS
ncbi:hypothetical protein [Actinomyces sp. 432]|uniref:hypothetical protein n=1 Tax=Actinomyces sp. 432 TaxID=2057798 RepID=UPI00137AFBA1|nr:hypothetical protein [Actinomyces sp. 432]